MFIPTQFPKVEADLTAIQTFYETKFLELTTTKAKLEQQFHDAEAFNSRAHEIHQEHRPTLKK